MNAVRSGLLAVAGLLALPALGAPRPNLNAALAVPPHTAPPLAPGRAPRATVTSFDPRTGTPTFLIAGPQAKGTMGAARALATPESAARFWLSRQAPRYSVSEEALASEAVRHVHDLGRGGVVVTLRQQVGGVEVFHSDTKVLLDRGYDLVAIGGHPHPAAVPGGKKGTFRWSGTDAVVQAVKDLEGVALSAPDLTQVERRQPPYAFWRLSAAASSRAGLRFLEPARVKRVYFPLGDRLVAGYFVELLTQRGEAGLGAGAAPSSAYDYVVSAEDGAVLYRQNLTRSAAFGYRVYADPSGDHRPWDGPLVDATPYPSPGPDGTFPATAAPNLITLDGFNAPHDPWLDASATVTTGNNVDAYTDDDAPDGFSVNDVRAAVNGSATFSYVFDLGAEPQLNDSQKMAAVTQLFYVTNWLHDWWYDSGFNEAAGNAQTDNYGRGGVAGDPLHAEAQDGAPSKMDNSNMSPMSDGTSPRMQMYLWSPVVTGSLHDAVTGQDLPDLNFAQFGPTSFTASGALVATVPADGCSPLTNDVNGKVALAQRGACSYEAKVLAAQDAGAIGVVVVNNVPGAAPPMGNDASINTPAVIGVISVDQEEGATLSTELGQGPVTLTLTRNTGPRVDGDLDGTIIAHEWGHYLHLRQVACGSDQCGAQSEGWGDFTALQMVVREGDNLDGTFPLGQFAMQGLGGDPGYFGIRRYPYSVDFSKDPLTFQDITSGQALPAGAPVSPTAAGDNSEVHAAGEVWASMLFEGYVSLLKESQKPSPRYTFDQARRLMADYVEGGLQLAPADPTYTEQRDAILAAAAAADPQDASLLAQAFARRGAGTCAVSPARDSSDFAGVVEDFTVQPVLHLDSVRMDDAVGSCDSDGVLDVGETGKVHLVFSNRGGADFSGDVTVSTTGEGLHFPAGAQASFVAPAGGQVTVDVDVSLDASAASPAVFPLHVELAPAASCDGSTGADATTLLNYDVTLASSATDTVEATPSAWTVTGTQGPDVWTREQTAADAHAWRGVDFGSPSDTALVSPPLQVSSTEPFTLAFDAAYQFETSGGTYWDGAVLELSTDGGGTWVDVSTYGDPGYGGTIGDPTDGAHNVLKDRQGYVDHNASYPAADRITVDLGTSLAGQTVQVRFRIGSDDASGAAGMLLDNLAFTGITNAPFPSLVPQATGCEVPDGGTPDAGSDAGVSDAGTADGGTRDAGVSDSDSDAGVNALPDGGLSGKPETAEGCGCQSGDAGFGPTLPLFALVGLFWLRRRRVRA